MKHLHTVISRADPVPVRYEVISNKMHKGRMISMLYVLETHTILHTLKFSAFSGALLLQHYNRTYNMLPLSGIL